MLDEKKVRSMARCALYEQSFGTGTIKINKQFEKGAYRRAFLYHFPSGVLTFFLVVFLAAAFRPEQARALYESLGFAVSLLFLVLAFLLFSVIYAFYARAMSRRKYEENKGVFWKYRFIKDKTSRLSAEKTDDAAMSGGAGT